MVLNFLRDNFFTLQDQFWVNSIMTPAEQYRTLVRRLDAILEQGLKPPSDPPSNPIRLPDNIPEPQSSTSWFPRAATASSSPQQQDPAQVQQGMAQLQRRCQSLVSKLSAYTTPYNQHIISKITVTVVDDPEDDDLYAYVFQSKIVLDYSQWDDAPDNVLLWSLGHEVGHICLLHHSKGNSPQQLQQQELDADQFATRLCLAMGVKAAPAFKWANDKRDRLNKLQAVGTLHQNRLKTQNNPANAGSQQQSTHPTYQRRFDHAAQDKFELSRVDTDQLDRFTAHMSRVA